MAARQREWPRRLAWLLLLWSAGVAALGGVAYALRWLMTAVGLST